MPTPTIVITGGTSGIGRLAAAELVRRGARVAITARDPGKAEQTRQQLGIRAEDVFLGDFARLDDVARVGREIAERFERVDVLVNNAGLHAFEARTTPDGFPEMVAVNYLAPWLLARTLLPVLKPGVRVVNVASEASRRHGTVRLPQDLTETVPFTARGSSVHYGRSKLFDIMFTKELARRLPGSAVAADPGFNTTGLGRELRFAATLEKVLTRLKVGDPRRGAGLIVKLAQGHGRNGGYYTARGTRPIEPAPPGDDLTRQGELWRHTEELVKRWTA